MVNDPVQFLRRTQYNLSAHEAEYSINWSDIYKTAQITFMENSLEQTAGMGPYHVRILRILKTKGFLVENEIKQMSLLP